MKSSNKNKSFALKSLLDSNKLEFAMEAHSGISAVIAEEAGFNCLWASGLSVSAMTGCRDRNELDISEVCKVVEWMADHTSIPILVDGDTGGVDFNAARIMVNKLTKVGAAGVCIEDKRYPKHNSFLDNSCNDLADPYFHAGKIKAMKDENPEFVVVARLEGYISGSDFDDIYNRALIYQDAGADAILVHSKKKTSEDIVEFVTKWNTDRSYGNKRAPIVIVPTKYYTTPTDEFRSLGISLVIWANHNMRASIKAMQETSKDIYYRQSLVGVEKNIVSVSEIFRLQRDDELVKNEEKYLPAYGGSALILSATTCKYNPELPKALEVVDDKTILDRQLQSYESVGVKRANIVLGSHNEKYKFGSTNLRAHPVVNKMWSETTEVGSMIEGLNQYSDIKLPLFISYGDLVFKSQILSRMTQSNSDIVIGVDPEYDLDRYNEFISGDRKYSRLDSSDEFNVKDCDVSLPDNDYSGSFIGMICVNTQKGLNELLKALQEVSTDNTLRFCEVLKLLVDRCKVKGVYVTSNEWVDVNGMSDIEKAGAVYDGSKY